MDTFAEPLLGNDGTADVHSLAPETSQISTRPHYPNRAKQWQHNVRPILPPRPRLIYDQHRCKICAPPLTVGFVAAALVILGCLLLGLPVSGGGGLVLIVGCTFTAAGVVLPLVAFCTCIACKTPSRARRMRDGLLADALLEELMAGAAINAHYDCFGADHAPAGTVLLLAGAACPRISQRRFAEALAGRFRTLIVDLPGHGSLVSVAFSLRRCERLLNRVLERELGIAAEATDAVAVAAAFAQVCAHCGDIACCLHLRVWLCSSTSLPS